MEKSKTEMPTAHRAKEHRHLAEKKKLKLAANISQSEQFGKKRNLRVWSNLLAAKKRKMEAVSTKVRSLGKVVVVFRIAPPPP